jgi:hypothetical protein
MMLLVLILIVVLILAGLSFARGWMRWCLVGLLALLIAGFILIGHWFAESLFNAPPEDFAHSLREPIALDVARQELDFPLPDGATNILYAQYAQWIAYEFMLKYEAPLEVCKSHALVLLQRHNTNMTERLVPVELRALSEPPKAVPPEPPLNVDWFDIHNITNGFIGGAFGSHQPMIWIDADRGILYYRYTD